MRLWGLSCLFMLSGFSICAQTFTGTGGVIPDDGSTALDIPLNISGLSSSTLTAAFGLTTVCFEINHTYDADLQISLVAPDGTQVMLANGNGGGDDNFTNTCFDQTSPVSIGQGTAPFTGTYKPMGNLGFINNGQNGNGTWHLHVFDTYPTDTGVVLSWTITFGLNAPIIAPFVSSNLPIVIINTNGQPIQDEPKVLADMGIIYNGTGLTNNVSDPHNNYDGNIGIEVRGSSSQGFPKLSYGLETWTATGQDTGAVLLGMPKESDWILSASYSDKSLMNNVLACELSNRFGSYAPRTRFVELVLNGHYQGVYILMEKIKRDSNRVDISKMSENDTTGTTLTGGYIVKIDKGTGNGGDGWTSNFLPPANTGGQTIFFQYEYPSDVKIRPQQQQYIQRFVDSFEHALHDLPLYDTSIGWRKYADESSFIKYFLVNELSKNVDGYRLSTYLYKKKFTKGNKLYVGPPWDYDIAFDNADYCGGSDDTGWAYQFGNLCGGDYWQIPFWWEKLMSDTVFQNNLKCEYEQLRMTTLDTSNLFGYIDSVATLLNQAQARNFEIWPILGTYVWPNPSPIPATYAGEVAELKHFLLARINWLDSSLPGHCIPPPPTGISTQGAGLSCSVSPNPFNNELRVEVNSISRQQMHLSVFTIEGQQLLSKAIQVSPGKNSCNLSELGNMPAGVYMLQIKSPDATKVIKLIKQ